MSSGTRPDGYRARKYGEKGNICSKCVRASNLDISGFETLSRSQFADIHCAVCYDCITSGARPSRPESATEQLRVLIAKAFEKVHPALTTAPGEEAEIQEPRPGVKISRLPDDAKSTIVISVFDRQRKNNLEQTLSNLSECGEVRYNVEKFEEEDGNIIFDFRVVV